jgi:hypothetical protein
MTNAQKQIARRREQEINAACNQACLRYQVPIMRLREVRKAAEQGYDAPSKNEVGTERFQAAYDAARSVVIAIGTQVE